MSEAAATNRPVAARRRSGARLAAVQFSYQMTFNPGEPEQAIEDYLAYYANDIARALGVRTIDKGFFAELARLVMASKDMLDGHISACLDEGWKLERLASNELGLLRGGVAELALLQDIPARTVLAEYTALADFFEADTRFVNAVLDRLARQLRPQEMPSG